MQSNGVMTWQAYHQLLENFVCTVSVLVEHMER